VARVSALLQQSVLLVAHSLFLQLLAFSLLNPVALVALHRRRLVIREVTAIRPFAVLITSMAVPAADHLARLRARLSAAPAVSVRMAAAVAAVEDALPAVLRALAVVVETD
jgi:hypothetical protein